MLFKIRMARRALPGMSIGVHVIAAHYLLNHGTEEQKRRYLPRMAKGQPRERTRRRQFLQPRARVRRL